MKSFLAILLLTNVLAALFAGCGYQFTPPVISPYAGEWKPTASFNYGDSITACVGVADSANCYVHRIAAYLNIGSTTNRARGADQACDVGKQQVFSNADLATPATNQPLQTLLIGTNDARQGRRGPYEGTFNLCHQAVLAWLGTPSSSKVLGSAAVESATGNCAKDETFVAAIGIACTASGSTAQISITTTGAPIYIWYRVIDGDPGAFTYSIDASAPVRLVTSLVPAISTENGSTDSVALARVPCAGGSHTIDFRQTSDGTMGIVAVGTLSPSLHPYVVVGDVPSQRDGSDEKDVRAYRVDIANNVKVLAGDGLNLEFAPVSKYLNASTDAKEMYDALHPNDNGHAEIFAAFVVGIKLLPGALAPNK